MMIKNSILFAFICLAHCALHCAEKPNPNKSISLPAQESLFVRPPECQLFFRSHKKEKDPELHKDLVYGPVEQDVINKHNIAMDSLRCRK